MAGDLSVDQIQTGPETDQDWCKIHNNTPPPPRFQLGIWRLNSREILKNHRYISY